MFFITGVDALRAVSAVEVLVEPETGVLFQHGHAVFFCAAGVDGGFVNDDVALLQHLADGFAGLDERGEVRPLVFVDGCGDGDDVAVAALQVVQVGGVAEMFGSGEFFLGGLKGEVVASFEFVDATLVDVEADYGTFAPEFDGKREADITQADDGKFNVL